jgi:hypothetical protein
MAKRISVAEGRKDAIFIRAREEGDGKREEKQLTQIDHRKGKPRTGT